MATEQRWYAVRTYTFVLADSQEHAKNEIPPRDEEGHSIHVQEIRPMMTEDEYQLALNLYATYKNVLIDQSEATYRTRQVIFMHEMLEKGFPELLLRTFIETCMEADAEGFGLLKGDNDDDARIRRADEIL